MTHPPPALPEDAGLTRGKPRTAFAQCDGCRLRGSQLCRIFQTAPVSGNHPPVRRRFGRGQRIVGQDDPGGFLGVIRRGFARRSVIQTSGRRILLGLAMPGDVVGGLLSGATRHDIEAATHVEICSYDSGTVKRQLDFSQPFRRLMLQEIALRHRRLLDLLLRNGTLNSRERITAFLVKAAEFMPTVPHPDGGIVLSMKIDRKDWADLTNTTVETVSRTLRYLEGKGLITSLSPHQFRLRDPERLARTAGVEPPAGCGGRNDRSRRIGSASARRAAATG